MLVFCVVVVVLQCFVCAAADEVNKFRSRINRKTPVPGEQYKQVRVGRSLSWLTAAELGNGAMVERRRGGEWRQWRMEIER